MFKFLYIADLCNNIHFVYNSSYVIISTLWPMPAYVLLHARPIRSHISIIQRHCILSCLSVIDLKLKAVDMFIVA
jgi:hypothetical protein